MTVCEHCGKPFKESDYLVTRQKGEDKMIFHDWCYPKWKQLQEST